MKTLKFNFGHPFKGQACLRLLHAGTPHCQLISLESKQNDYIEIPLNACKAGKWKAELNWEHEGRSFTHQENFVITD